MTNGDKSFVVWEPNQLHHHIHGIIDYCRIMADQTMCEAITPLVDFHHLTVAGVYGAGIARQIGIDLSTSAHLIDWFGSIGDTTNKVVVEAHALDLFDVAVKADTCLSGFPVGCTPPPVGGTGSPEDTNGVSKVRGQPTGSRGQFCPSSTSDEMYRIGQFFETSMLIDGTYHFAWQKGPSWNEYNIATDNVYGMSQADLTELYGWDGTTRWKLGTVGSYYGNGSRYELALDISTNCGTTVAGGTATLLGTTVTRASGPVFDATYVGRTFFVDANGATISAVNVGAQTLTISRNLGTYSRPVFYQTNPTGHATASGTSFVLADGPSFDNSWVGSYISIGGFTKVKVDAFNDASHLTLHSGVGTISTPTNYLLNAEQSGTYLYVLGLSDGTHRDAQNTIQSNAGTIWSNFWGIYQNNHTISDWRTKFDISLIWGGQGVSSWLPDYGSYKVGALISVINANSNLALQDVSFTITDNGTGHYHVGLTPRAGSTKLRIKYSPTSSRAIAPSTGILGYNTDSQTFAIDPTTHVSWFGANAMSEPAPTPGVAMSIPVDTGGIMGLTNPGNWSVKELAPKVSGGVADLVLGGKVSVSGRQ
jgi:hypothetical protein